MDRAEHLQWCKDRANACIDAGDTRGAFSSMTSDLEKHDETMGHGANQLGLMQLMSGFLDEPDQMRNFINGYN